MQSLKNSKIFSAMAMAMSIYTTLCVLVFYFRLLSKGHCKNFLLPKMCFCIWKSTISVNVDGQTLCLKFLKFYFSLVFWLILTYLLFVNNSEKIEFWVPFLVPFYVVWIPFCSPFCSKLGPLFRIFGSPFHCGTVKRHATFLYIISWYRIFF